MPARLLSLVSRLVPVIRAGLQLKNTAGLILSTIRWFVLCTFPATFLDHHSTNETTDRGGIHASRVLYQRKFDRALSFVRHSRPT